METLRETLVRLLENGSDKVDSSWVDEMSRQYPYFTVPALLQVKRDNGMSDERRRKLLRRISLNTPSKDVLYSIVEPMAADIADIYPPDDRPSAPTTDEAIDTFIVNYGKPTPREDELLERLIFNPTPDYALLLADEEEHSLPLPEEAAGDSRESLINAFIIKSKENHGHFPATSEESAEKPEDTVSEKTPEEPIQAPEVQDDSLLSESLAKIYIKQHRYAKAFEIISGLSLKYPEKSVYFADQLRFLQKLIINQQYQKQK